MMNKNLKTILFILLTISLVIILGTIIFLQQLNISSIFIEREWRERFDKNYGVENTFITLTNNREFDPKYLTGELGPDSKRFGTVFDQKRDTIFWNDPDKNYDYNILSGGRSVWNIRAESGDTYKIGVSVCQDRFLNCKTKYYNNPTCVELIYVPDFYERKREKILNGCETIDVSNGSRDNIFFSIKY